MFPTIKDLAAGLGHQKRWLDKDNPEMDVRLQVVDGGWYLRVGDSSYDQDHRGYWGCGYLARSTNCRELAKGLIEQAREHAAQCS